jgi:hypothetical protein
MRRDFLDAGDPGLPAGLGPPLRSEAIHSAANEEWIASSLALLAMTATIFARPGHRLYGFTFQTARRIQTRLRDLAAAFARGLSEFRVPLRSEGAGNAGRTMHPQPRAQQKKRTSVVTTVTPERPGIPRAMVLRLASRSPR